MSAANEFYKELKDNPENIIKWCEEEIDQYQKLIGLIKRKAKPCENNCDNCDNLMC
jgi:endonuclease III